MQSDIVSTVLLPLILAFMMFSLGLGLVPADFRRIIAQPRALWVGLVCHFVLLPLVCWYALGAFGITGVFAVGFMILASCPTGTTSNILTYLARGDVALALSFTAVASVLTIFTLPFIVTMSLDHFMGGAAQPVQVPVLKMMVQVAMVLGLPVSIGMVVRHRWTHWALGFEPNATRIATWLFVLILLLAVRANWTLLHDNFFTLAPFAVALNLAMLTVGFVAAWLVRLSRQQSVTLGIETAMQNATLSMLIGSTVLKSEAMAVPGALYGVLMYVGGLLFAMAMRRVLTPTGAAQSEVSAL